MILIPVKEMKVDLVSLVQQWLLGQKFCIDHILSLPGWRGAYGVIL